MREIGFNLSWAQTDNRFVLRTAPNETDDVQRPTIDTDLDQRGFRAPGTAWMVAGSLIGAVGAYLFQVVGGRALGSVDFAPVSILWTLLFILATVVLVPVEQYVTREASLGRRVLRHDLLPIAVAVGLTALAGAGFVALTLDRLFVSDPVFVLQAGAMLVGYGMLFVGKGILAGHRRFAGVGWILFGESMLRLAAAVVFLLVVASAVSLGWAMVLAPLAALALRFWRVDRSGRAEGGGSNGTAGGFLRSYVAGSAASQLLLGGAPLGVAALGGGPAVVSIVFVTFTLFRAPLTLIYALQGRLLPMLVRMVEADDRGGLRRFGAWILGVGSVLTAAGALVGWLVGPAVVELLFSAEFRPEPLVAMFAAAGVVAASAAQVAGQVLVAYARTGRLALAWITGLAVALVVLVVGVGAPAVTVALAFGLGALGAMGMVALLSVRSA